MPMLPPLLLRALYTRSHGMGGEKPLETSESMRGQSSTHIPGNPQISLPSFPQTQPAALHPSPSPSASFPIPLLGFPAGSRLPLPRHYPELCRDGCD